MLAAGTGMADSARLLLERGADLEAREQKRGQTALMWAAADGHSRTVETLIDLGADVNAASRRGLTALHLSVIKDDRQAIQALLAAGADPNAAAADGSLPTNIAAAYGHSKSLRLLLAAGGDFSNADSEGRTPLYAASIAGDAKIGCDAARRRCEPEHPERRLSRVWARTGT